MACEDYRKKLNQKLIESAAKVVYTYTAHWKIVDRLKCRQYRLKICQIILTGVASCGLLSILFGNHNWVLIGGGICSFISLCLNLYMLNFDLPNQIMQHTNAANELWSIREAYVALITDFEILTDDEIRNRRDLLTERISRVNNNYPGTDKDSYKEAQIALKQEEEQYFGKGEAEHLLNIMTKKSL